MTTTPAPTTTTPEPWQITSREYALRPESSRVPRGSILATNPDKITFNWLMARSLDELGALCITLGAPSSGTRAQLTDRIQTHTTIRRLLKGTTAGRLRGGFTATYLRGLLRAVGAYAPPNAYGAARALIAWRDSRRQAGQLAIAQAKHYQAVCRAIRYGQAVPPDVLAEYPQLQPQPLQYPLFDRNEETTP